VRRTLPVVLAIAAYFAGVLLWLAHDRRISRHAFDDFSTLNTNDGGLSLAAAYLKRSGHDVRTLTEPINERSVKRDAVVFRVGGVRVFDFTRIDEEEEQKPEKKKKPKPKTHYVTPLLTETEETFVRGGGRLVIAVDSNESSLSVATAPEKLARKVFPLWRGVDTLDFPVARGISGDALRNAHAVYAIGDRTAMARIAIGAGDVLVFAAPEALDNEHIARQLPLLVALAGEHRVIYFDELLHGMREDTGSLELLKQWGLGPFLLLLLAIAAVIIWRHATRIGEPDDEYRDTRSDAIDLVASLGALYERTMTRGEALAAYHRELTRAVAASSGLRGDALRRRVDDLTIGLTPAWKHQTIDDETFAQHIRTINEAFRRLSPRAAARGLAGRRRDKETVAQSPPGQMPRSRSA
jgi:hypothetical protein